MPREIAIVTDSTADLPPELAQQHQIEVVANLLTIDGQNFEDGSGLSREDFYTRLPRLKTLPSTGTASSGVYENLYERLLQQGARTILSIHASSRLSGIVNAATAAARSFGERVRVFDSYSITLGLGFQVLAAAEAAEQGISFEAALRLLEAGRERARVIAMLDTLEFVARSGRVSWARARLGNFLRIKPFVELKDGRVFSLGEARTRRKGIERLAKLLQQQGPVERFAMLHTNALEDARRFLQDFNPVARHPPLIVNVTTVIGTHVGPKGLGFAVLRASSDGSTQSL